MTKTAIAVADEIAVVLDEYAAAWSARALRRVARLWDEQEPSPTYAAEELAEVLTDRASIVEHLTRTESRLEETRVTIGRTQVTELGEDLVLAVFHCRWELEWVSFSRVGAIFRRREDGWRFAHYMEAPFHAEDWVDEPVC